MDLKEAHEWAVAHCRPYLLGMLSEEEDARVHEVLDNVEGFREELDEAEYTLINDALDEKLGAAEQKGFRRIYEEGPPSQRIKLKLERAIRLPEGQVRRVPAVKERRQGWRWLSLPGGALALVALIFGILAYELYRESNRNSVLETEIQTLRQDVAKTKRDEPEKPTENARGELPGPKPNQERRAGEAPAGGLVLDARSRTARLSVVEAPETLIWQPIADSSIDYRMRIRPAMGAALESGILRPKASSVEFSPEDAAGLALPWEVTVYRAAEAEQPVARYTVVKRTVGASK